ncbi:unnamed protein product [Agarophyton chilense]
MATPSHKLQDAVRSIMSAETSPRRRQAAISRLFSERTAALIAKHHPPAVCVSSPPRHEHHDQHELRHRSFPGAGVASAGCNHYRRNCWILADCCDRYFPCRRCHDEQTQTHQIDRYATKMVACVKCGDVDQPVRSHCRSCGVQFARYFCGVCKFYDDTPGRHAYHCEGCGMCRVGKGLGIDNYHCYGCGNCIPMAFKDKHPCRERSLDANCPICTEYLATSTDPMVFLRCGHTMHANCLKELAASGYTCPICNKSMADMSKWYKQLDEQIKNEVVPREFVYKRSLVLCHECHEETHVRFHLVHHKCGACGSYNTRLLRHYDVTPRSDEAASAAAAAAAATAAAPSLRSDRVVLSDRNRMIARSDGAVAEEAASST